MTSKNELSTLFGGVSEINEETQAARIKDFGLVDVEAFANEIEPEINAREQQAHAAQRAEQAAVAARNAERPATLADIWAREKVNFPLNAFKVEIEGHGQVKITNLKNSKNSITIMQKNNPDNHDDISFDITENGVTAPKSSVLDVLFDLRRFEQRNKTPAKTLAATP
jgi:hypothetical protein